MSASLRLVAIEEDASALSQLEVLLRQSGHAVRAVSESRRALAEVSAFQPSLVLVQRSLRGPTGFEIARAIHSSETGRLVPIVFMSKDRSWAELIRSVRAGGMDVLHTPPDGTWLPRLQMILASLSASPSASARELSRAENLATLLHRNRVTGTFRVNAGTPFEGRATFREGEFLSADYGPLTGLAALEEMLGFEDDLWSFEELTRPRSPLPPPPASAGSSSGGRVLIVDDAPELRRLYERRLSRVGLEVSLAEDGVEALSLLEGSSFDVVVADLNMPRLDGWGLLRRMREDVRLREVPVLFLSAHDDYRETLRAARAGARDYLPKTGRAEHVIERVQALIRPRQQLAAALAALNGSDAALQVPLHLVGPFWMLDAIGAARFSGTLAAHDRWGEHTLTFSHGAPAEILLTTPGRRITGLTALASFLLAQPRDATLTARPVDTRPASGAMPLRSMSSALQHALSALARLEARVSSQRLRQTVHFLVDEPLYALYQHISPHEMLAFARAVCEERVPTHQLAEHLGVTAETVDRGLRDLLRRRVIAFPEDEEGAH